MLVTMGPPALDPWAGRWSAIPGVRPSPGPVNECLAHPLTGGGRRRRMRRCPSSSSPPTTGSGSVAAGAPGISAPGPGGDWCPAPPRSSRTGAWWWRSGPRWRCTTSPACGPGTGRSSSRCVHAAYEQAGGPADGLALLEGFLRWAATADEGTPLRVEADIDVHVPDPVLPDTHLASAAGDAVRYRDRIDLVLVGDDDRCWLGEHRVVRQFADDDELRLDERARARVLGLGGDRAGHDDHRRPVHGVAHRPAGVPAAVGPAVGRREGRHGAPVGASRPGDDRPDVRIDPDPSWVHSRAVPVPAPGASR